MQESSRTTDVPPNPFANTKSILLDGIDDYVTMGDVLDFERTDAFSISAWVKRGGTGVNDTVVSKMESSGNYRGYLLFIGSANVVKFVLRHQNNSTARLFVDSTSTITDTNWHHISVTYDGSSSVSGVKIYIDGVNDTVTTAGTLNATTLNSSPFNIGARNSNSLFATATIDEVALFNSELSQSNVTSIYNNGVPNDISSLSPISWWRCGDGDTAPTLTDNGSGSNNGTMTNFSTFSTDVPFNYKSIQLDGVDDYVDCGTGLGNSQGTITNFSVSMWIKPSVTSGNDLFFNIGNFSNSFGEIAFQLLSNTLFIKIDNSAYRVWMPYTNTSAWEHLAFVYDGSNSANTKMYINGVLQSPSTGGVHPSSLNLSGLKTIIGAGYSVSYPYSGLQDEVSYFNTTLSQSDITSIYNDGVPNDISSLSPLSWWRCGDGDTAPTLTDNGSASNDGTMTNFTTFSTDVPT